jgi:hypothetical protein
LIRIYVFSHVGLDTLFPLVLSVGESTLSVGGGGSDAGPSGRALDLNVTPPPEPAPEPAPPTPLSAETEEALRMKRERVKDELRFLLQIGYGTRARPYKKADSIIKWIGLDAERDPCFLDRLYNHLYELSRTLGGSVGQPQKLNTKGLDELHCWILKERENRARGDD